MFLPVTEPVPPLDRYARPRRGENPRSSRRRRLESLLRRRGPGDSGRVCHALWDRVNLPGHDVSLRYHTDMRTFPSLSLYLSMSVTSSSPSCSSPSLSAFRSHIRVPLNAVVAPCWPPNERKSIINGLRMDLSP